MPDLTRVSLNLTPRTTADLEALASTNGLNNTDNINRAIQLYKRVVTGEFELIRRTASGDIEHVILG